MEGDQDKRRDLFREAKRLAESEVKDEKLAEQVLRQLVENDETYVWAFEELTKFREKAEDWPEVVKLLQRRAELTETGPEIIALKHQAAAVLRDKIKNNTRALEIYEEVFEADPFDAKAAEALRALYASENRHRDLSALLERLIEVANNPKDRTVLRLELANLFAAKFDAVADAIDVLLRVLEEEPGQTDAVVALSQLYEKSGKDSDLADLLNQPDRARQAEG